MSKLKLFWVSGAITLFLFGLGWFIAIHLTSSLFKIIMLVFFVGWAWFILYLVVEYYWGKS